MYVKKISLNCNSEYAYTCVTYVSNTNFVAVGFLDLGHNRNDAATEGQYKRTRDNA